MANWPITTILSSGNSIKQNWIQVNSKKTEAPETLDFKIASLLRTSRKSDIASAPMPDDQSHWRPKEWLTSLLFMWHIFFTAICCYVLKMMESGHQDLEKIRSMTIFNQDWNTETCWELGKHMWIKKQKQTPNPALFSCHWNQILVNRWTELSFTITAFQVFIGVYFDNSHLFPA